MNEFDEMLRAGTISPGSTPRVESKRPPTSADEPADRIKGRARTVSEKRSSVPARVERGFSQREPVTREGPLLLICPDLALAKAVTQVLKRDRRCITARDASVLESGFGRFSLVVCDADLPGFDALVECPLPLIVLAREASMASAEAALGERRAPVLMLPFEAEVLLKAVRTALASGQPPRPR